MGVVIESSVWEPNPSLFIFIFISSLLSIYFLPHFSKSKTLTAYDHGVSSSFLRFQRYILFLYCVSSVMEGLWSVYGELELSYFEVNKEQMVFYLFAGYAASLLVGPFLGALSDLIGQKKVVLMFCIIHLFVGIWKKISAKQSAWIANIWLSLATSIFSVSFETWVVVEHEKQGQRNESLTDMFWLMTFFESASLIGSQMIANWLFGDNVEHGISSSSTVSMFMAVIGIICITKSWKETPHTLEVKDYITAFYTYILGDKRIWLLGLAHACLQFSIGVFWILWAPTMVADGREVYLGLIYPCLLGARMLGSTAFPWFISGPSTIRTEDCLLYAFSVLGFVLSIIAYDYQEIGVLLTLYCIFHACVGLILPSLASLRTMYVPNEMRGGMIGLSLAPANALLLFFLMQRGYSNNIENSTMLAFAALGLIVAAGCMHVLRRLGKHPHQDWHQL